MKSIYFTNRIFYAFTVVINTVASGYVWKPLYWLGLLLLCLLLAMVLLEIVTLFSFKYPVLVKRSMATLLSIGDDNKVTLNIRSNVKMELFIRILDELPIQLQERNFNIFCKLKPTEKRKLIYTVYPVERGMYVFNDTHIFISIFFRFVERKITADNRAEIGVYPSIIQMKKYELLTLTKISSHYGIKKMRRIGHSYEFEQIKNYVMGDDVRCINWKATARRNELMVNHFEDEKSQQVYSVIDKSRIMHMPFNGMTLMDYAINTSLMISNVALLKSDKPGLITFSDKLGTIIRSERSNRQLKRILEALYNQKLRDTESDFEMLYHGINKVVNGRSLVIIYTNFESIHSMQRVLPILRKINKFHLLVLVMFENTEIIDFINKVEPSDVRGIYTASLAEQMVVDKRQIAQEIRNYGIQCIINKPEELSISTLNKYLELKARGMI